MGAARIDVGGEHLELRRELLEVPPGRSLEDLDLLLALARSEQLPIASCVLAEGPLLPLHLRAPDAIVTLAGVLQRIDPRRPTTLAADPTILRARLAYAASGPELMPILDGLTPAARYAIEKVLSLLRSLDRAVDLAAVPLAPSLARHLVRHGWLESVLGESEPVSSLVTVVTEACEPRVVELWAGSGQRLETLQATFGPAATVLATPESCRYRRPIPELEYHPATAPRHLVVTLPPDADPMRDADRCVAAAVFDEGRRLAGWSRGGGFDADMGAWREAVPDEVEELGEDLLPGWIPPHIPVYDLAGDLRLLITAHGTVRPPRDASPEEQERFLDEATRALPDAAHLDLLGEVIFRYVNDSPDPTLPLLVGSPDAAGEIHQTVAETLATVAGGLMRGDCDDLAELYQAILQRQGRLAHVCELPSHNAAAWCTLDDDGSWRAWVLQTGPPLMFSGPTLPEALAPVFQAFSGEAIIDPDQLGISLRFSGENTRSSWVLGWRIFRDADYARTMVAVQRNWHFHTYHDAIAKMRALVEEGDRHAADLRELAALHASTGQHALAATWRSAALEATPKIQGRISLQIQLIADLLATEEAESRQRAHGIAHELAEKTLPPLRETLGEGEAWTRMSLAETLNAWPGNWELAAEVLGRPLLAAMSAKLAETVAWVEGPRFHQSSWANGDDWFQTRRMLRAFAFTILGILDEAGPVAVAEHGLLDALVAYVETWTWKLAFHDVEEPGEALLRCASAGALYQARLGRPLFEALLAATAAPEAADLESAHRTRGLSQLRRDLPWISISPSWWSPELMRLFERRRSHLDPERVAVLAQRVADAGAASARLGIHHFSIPPELAACRLIAALVARDEEELRSLLRTVRTTKDKVLTDSAAAWIGTAARFLEPEWFARVLELWAEEVDHKPSWFLIAWCAAGYRAPRHALLAADTAARRFPDDPTFVAEAAFMHELFDAR